MTSLLSIATTGLDAAQAGLTTTSHNIANASTTGYSRQSISQAAQTPLYTGEGFFGQGTSVSTVTRAYSSFLTNQVNTAQAASSQLDTYSTEIAQVDNILGDSTAGLSTALTSFFTSVSSVASDASSVSARQTMISSGQSLVARFQDLSAQLTEISDGVNSQISSEVTTINSLASQLAALNKNIAVAQGSANGQPANDLLDQRDELVAELNTHIKTTVVTQSDGSYSVFIGNGEPLVVGDSQFSLTATQSTDDPAETTIGLTTASGNTQQISESQLSGGALGGLLAFRNETLEDAQNSLGRIALGIATTVNTQSKLGVDLNGKTGTDFFTEPTATVFADSTNATATTAPGTISATISDVSSLTSSDYELTRTATGYSLTRLSDNTVVFTGASLPKTVDGMTISVSGTPAVGSSFKIEPTRYAARDISMATTDPNSIAAGLPVTASAGTSNTGSAAITTGTLTTPVTLTYSSTYQGYVGLPVGTTISVWNGSTTTQTTVTSSSQVVSIPVGSNATIDGITFQLNGAPSNGDTFTVGPNELQAGSANTGSAMIQAGGDTAATSFTYDSTTQSFSMTTLPSPTTGNVVTMTTSAGVTTQYPLTLTSSSVPYVAGATYQYNGVTFSFSSAPTASGTFTIGSEVAASASGTNTGTGTISALPTSSGASLTTSATTLTIGAGGTSVSGFPSGSVSVTTAAGVTTTYTSPSSTIPFAAGDTYSFGGVNVTLSGTPSAGDTFTVTPDLSTSTSGIAITQSAITYSAALPTSSYTLTYNNASNLLTGFPAGTTVEVTSGGTTTEVPITSTSSGVTYTAGMTLTVNGVAVTFSGTPSDGDTFTIAPSSANTTDNRNIQLIAALQTAKTMLSGTASFSDTYAQLVSQVGSKASEVESDDTAQTSLLSQAQTAQSSYSGVNLDEEASNLIRYQQAYQASAKVISIASTLFDTLLNIGS